MEKDFRIPREVWPDFDLKDAHWRIVNVVNVLSPKAERSLVVRECTSIKGLEAEENFGKTDDYTVYRNLERLVQAKILNEVTKKIPGKRVVFYYTVNLPASGKHPASSGYRDFVSG